MPGRLTPLVTGETYHVFNRGINKGVIFNYKRDYLRAVETIFYYHFRHPPVKFSKYLSLDVSRRGEIWNDLILRGEKLVSILCYCLMPNHFHLLLRQESDGGISNFMGNLQNSYTKYFNLRHDRSGSLLMDQFKGRRIESEEQLVHVLRYIHLNPYTGFVVRPLFDLEKYRWSSLKSYLTSSNEGLDIQTVMTYFKNTSAFRSFIYDQADYQRKLKEIEYVIDE